MCNNYWNDKFARKKYIWGLNPSESAILMVDDLKKEDGIKGSLLDIGCGYGRDVNYFNISGLNAYGIDKSPEAIQLGIKQWPDIRLICDDIFTYNFKSQKFNIAFCNFFIHLLQENQRKEIIKIIYDLLLDGGIAYFTVSSIDDIDFNLGEKVGYNLVKNERGVIKYYYNEDAIKEEFNIFNEINYKKFTEKHYHDYEHEHSNYFIKCKKVNR
ncbi:tellurite resistance protein TehB [Clostridium sp. N3C]|uniref:class I SAM-dependent methyltransferase n=1 Tax=Clostridium sp. N3C TaxID=1776758 RepID=UPI00092DF7A2|nr:class I SAM-dependent methyltransferase [Clostridium sp. N3C]NLZ35564.1 class I SAM-dependent methyltransferase [Clostridiales bacterium]SCN25783.1 tellurite resistance protein TehB [Clostridium sp. N3C]